MTHSPLPKLMYVSDSLSKIQMALDGGIQFVQYREKNLSREEMEKQIPKLESLSKTYNALFFLNDDAFLVKNSFLDGVHLGKTDMDLKEARKLLGDKKIGATANSLEDVLGICENLFQTSVDYIGLGPFAFTTTKKNLASLLGKKGIQDIVFESQNTYADLVPPIYAIGGITKQDFLPLMETGIHGIAVSGLISKSSNISKTTRELIDLLE
ncbi:MAG: thiamine phosphate synthase [Flavobacteriaceae bacterium]|nr:MAG: thiamine phosphate synthase [Flavobacteriaceae bacterium]